MGMRGQKGGDSVEECLGVNGRQLAVCVSGLKFGRVETWIVGTVSDHIRFMADHAISAVD